jgi:hypothetical protein
MWIVNFLKWLGSVVEDTDGLISSKRVGFFLCLWMLSRTIEVPNINEVVVYAFAALAFGLAGLTVPEFFATRDFKTAKTTETTTKTSESKDGGTNVVTNP